MPRWRDLQDWKGVVYTDPICPHDWVFSLRYLPELRRHWRERFGAELDLRSSMYPILERADRFADRWNHLSDVRQMAHLAADVGLRFGMPIAHRVWQLDPPNTSWPVGLGFHAARRQAGAGDRRPEERYLEEVRAAVHGRGESPDRILALADLAQRIGLDPERFLDDLADDGTEAELRREIALAQSLDVRTRPTLVLSDGAGRQLWLVGPRPPVDPAEVVDRVARGEVPVPDPNPLSIGGRAFRFRDLDAERPAYVDGGLAVETRLGTAARPAWITVGFERTKPESLPEALWAAGAGLADRLASAGGDLAIVAGRLGASEAAWVGARVRADDRPDGLTPAVDGLAAIRASLGDCLGRPGPDEVREVQRSFFEWRTRLRLSGPPARRRSRPLLSAAPRSTVLAGLARSAGEPTLEDGTAPFLLWLLAEPVGAREREAWEGERLDDLKRFSARLEDDAEGRSAWPAAFADGTSIRQRALERAEESVESGAWDVSAFFCTPVPEAEALVWLRDRWRRGETWPPEPPSPGPLIWTRAEPPPIEWLPPFAVLDADREHIRQHLLTWTWCEERNLHGSPRWRARLTGRELARLLAPLLLPI